MNMKSLALILGIIILTGCRVVTPTQTITEIIWVEITATPALTLTTTVPPTITPSPTATPTPTPTAIPASISGNPRAFTRLDPEPAFNAPCGFVDTLDFPLDPPHGAEASGGGDFGRYRQRYEKYHAGEDWGMRNVSNFGQPVYSIGHGQVTYAQPNGWGLDKGVIVIRHVFPTGRYILSFYGHLDPPSVDIKTGDCVERGDKIGKIGRPRTPPHLHFEIRLHLPNSTGHGYWSVDPTLAGWLPPSQTIHEYRISVSPGVQWTNSYDDSTTQFSGVFTDTLLLVHNEALVALDIEDGATRWQQAYDAASAAAILDTNGSQFYHLDQMGILSSHAVLDPAKSIWQIDSGALSTADLIAPPTGGVIVTDRRQTTAFDQTGERLWQIETKTPISSWVSFRDTFIFTTAGANPIWSVPSSGQPQNWDFDINGHLLNGAEAVYLHAEDGVYRLDVDAMTRSQWISLPQGRNNLGRSLPLPNGGLLLYHVDSDRRLIAINPSGTIQWERSILNALPKDVEFGALGRKIYLLATDKGASGNEVKLLEVDIETGKLTHLFTGGTRLGFSRGTWINPVNDEYLLVNIGGGPVVLISPQEAFDIIASP